MRSRRTRRLRTSRGAKEAAAGRSTRRLSAHDRFGNIRDGNFPAGARAGDEAAGYHCRRGRWRQQEESAKRPGAEAGGKTRSRTCFGAGPSRCRGTDGGHVSDAGGGELRRPERDPDLRPGRRYRERPAQHPRRLHRRQHQQSRHRHQHPRLRRLGPRQHVDRWRAPELQVHGPRRAGLRLRRPAPARRYRYSTRCRLDRGRCRRAGRQRRYAYPRRG